MRVLIADKNFLSRTGLEFFLKKHFENVIYTNLDIEGFRNLSEQIKRFSPNIVFLDYISLQISADEVETLIKKYKDIKFILITEWLPKDELMDYLRSEVKWHLLKECDESEIRECVEYALNNQSFFCNKLIQFIQSQEIELSSKKRKSLNCKGILITPREREIIRLIAEGKSNKQIADKLNISIHTVLTHRKNIMKKTNSNNTAGLVLFALKNNIIVSDNHFLFSKNG